MGADRSRKHKFTLYLSDNEYRLLDAKTKVMKMRSMSSTLRQLLIEGFLYDVDYSYIREYNYQLSMIGRNLNQIARHTNETGSVTREEFDNVKKIMDEIWKLHLKFLDKVPLGGERPIEEFNQKKF